MCPRGGFWERESGPQGRPGAEVTRELRLPQYTAAAPLWEALGAPACAGEWRVCRARLGRGRRQGWGWRRGRYPGALCLRDRRESCSEPGGLK